MPGTNLVLIAWNNINDLDIQHGTRIKQQIRNVLLPLEFHDPVGKSGKWGDDKERSPNTPFTEVCQERDCLKGLCDE